MTIRVGVAILAAILTCPLWAGAPVLAKETFSFAYLQRVGDSHYERHRAYTGLALRDQYPPVDGARVALRDSRLIGRSLGIGFELLEAMLAKDEEAPAAIRRLMAEQNIRVFLLDLPIEEVVAAAAALARENVILFNLRHRADALRAEHCAPNGLECPLLAISRHTEGSSRTSALPPIADIQTVKSRKGPLDVRFAPTSGH